MDLDLWQGKMFQVVKGSRGNQNHGTLWLQWNIILEYLRVHSPTLWLWRAGDIVSVSHRVPFGPHAMIQGACGSPDLPTQLALWRGSCRSRSGTQPCCYAKLPSSSTNIFRNWCQGPKDSKMRKTRISWEYHDHFFYIKTSHCSTVNKHGAFRSSCWWKCLPRLQILLATVHPGP